jgi:type IV pilus assembly protein PilO
MKIGFREFLFLTVLVSLLAASGVVFKKQNAKMEDRKQETARKQAELTNLKLSTAGIGDLNTRIKDIGDALKFFDSKLPQEKEFNNILDDLSGIAQANSLQSKTVRSLKTERFSGYSEQPIQLSLSGNFNGFYSFLLQLEKLPRITKITDMHLNKIQDHDGEMQATMTLSIFFEPDGVTGSMTTASTAGN